MLSTGRRIKKLLRSYRLTIWFLILLSIWFLSTIILNLLKSVATWNNSQTKSSKIINFQEQPLTRNRLLDLFKPSNTRNDNQAVPTTRSGSSAEDDKETENYYSELLHGNQMIFLDDDYQNQPISSMTPAKVAGSSERKNEKKPKYVIVDDDMTSNSARGRNSTYEETESFGSKNQRNFERLLKCHWMQSFYNKHKKHQFRPNSKYCLKNDDKIILLGSVHFKRVTEGIFDKKASFPSGEAIWADALVYGLDRLKYPFLVINGIDHFHTNKKLNRVYKLLNGDLNVKMVIGDYLSVPKCLKDEKDCIRSRVDPSGIPSHKLFVFDGFGIDVGHPLGRRWHLSFYPKLEEGFSFLGLTIEHYCKNFSVVPPKLRPKKIYILGKDRGYFYPPSPQLFKRDMWKRISDKTGIGFTMGTFQRSKEIDEQRQNNDTSGYEKAKKFADFEPIEGIDDIGTQTRSQFIYQIQNHRAVIGLGWPVQPSTPLEALCVGTPFINPVWVGRRSQPDRSKWHSQHPYLAHFDPPFVYNVQDQREDDILESIEMILKKPLEGRFIPDELKIESYLNRLKDLVEFDWKELSLQKNNKKK